MARNNYKSEKRRKELKKQKKRQEKDLRKEQRKLETYDEDGNLIENTGEPGEEGTDAEANADVNAATEESDSAPATE